ncbi:MAG: hypothetical protein M0R51_14115 [Clostridia bacterium]|jgi:hypothetical protein|nr:hypothetical protein [Clostridia bacterium]
MDNEVSQIVKVRYNKSNGVYSLTIPLELREFAKQCKYMECTQDKETGNLIYRQVRGV